MATTSNHFTATMLLLSLLFITSLDFTAGQVGVCFGRQGNNLPGVQRTIALYKKNNITRMRLFDPHPPTLRALAGTGIQLLLGVADNQLQDLANCPQAANSWVRRYVQQHPNVTFSYIVVGNEIAPESTLAPFVLPAMENVYRALRTAGLGGLIRVSTSIKTDLLNTILPPQAGEFKCSVNWFIRPIINFLAVTRTPLLTNVFPYFVYMNDWRNISLSFALLQPNSGVVYGGVYYDNLFYAIVDAIDVAMERILAAAPVLFSDDGEEKPKNEKPPPKNENPPPKNEKPPQHPTSGWSSGGGGHNKPKKGDYLTGLNDGPINTVQNARIYNNNLMRIVRTGTPRMPGRPLETDIFAMYDENLRPGPPYERHFGIFLANGQPKYPLRFR